MELNGNASCAECASPTPDTAHVSAAVAGILAAILIFTIVADVIGNTLVFLSVYRNKKLRNAGKEKAHTDTLHLKLLILSKLQLTPTSSLKHDKVVSKNFTEYVKLFCNFHQHQLILENWNKLFFFCLIFPHNLPFYFPYKPDLCCTF